jgi:aminocarboxymuconate-semialdehyde decarboxylase
MTESRMRSPVIDVHTHMLTNEWVALLEQHGGPRYTLKSVAGGLRAIHLDGAPFMTPVPPMFDWELRIANMNKARVDIAITSLSCPNCYWGSAEVSLKAARVMNDDMAKAQRAWPERIRWFASLPWQHADLALQELRRSCDAGAVGVMVLANIGGKALTDSSFASTGRKSIVAPYRFWCIRAPRREPPSSACTSSSSPRRSASPSTPPSRWRAASTTASSTATRT